MNHETVTLPPSDPADSRAQRALWFGIVAPPLAALTQLGINYAVTPWACAAGATAGHVLLLHVISACMLAVALVACAVSWRQWGRREEGAADDLRTGRNRFLATLGWVGSVLFAGVVIAEWMPIFFLHPCVRM